MVDLGALVNTDLVKHPELIKQLIDAGVNPNGCSESENHPLAEIMKLTHLSPKERIKLLCLFLENGADCSYLCHGSQYKTTPVHVATRLALEAGMIDLDMSVTCTMQQCWFMQLH